MSRGEVLAAAAALGTFTPEQAGAYCGVDASCVLNEIASLPGILGPVPPDGSGRIAAPPSVRQQWRVLQPTALRQLIARLPPDAGSGGCTGAESSFAPVCAEEDLLLAEESLVECGRELSRASRRLLTATARNHLRQFLAANSSGGRSWWEIDEASIDDPDVVSCDSDVNVSRLRADASLIALSESEAKGDKVELPSLIATAKHLGDCPAAMDGSLRSQLFGRFLDLVLELTSPTGDTAPARYVSALAWGRARALGGHDVSDASRVATTLIERLLADGAAVRHDADHLFKVLGHLPDGRARVEVYADLLHLVPRQFGWREEQDSLPGVLVQAVTDEEASTHLRDCADILEGQLYRSPFPSGAALIGQVAHVLPDIAARFAAVDEGVGRRSEETRRELLSLLDAPVSGAPPARVLVGSA